MSQTQKSKVLPWRRRSQPLPFQTENCTETCKTGVKTGSGRWDPYVCYVIENLQNLRLLRGISRGSNPSNSVCSLTYPSFFTYLDTSLEDVLFGIFSVPSDINRDCANLFPTTIAFSFLGSVVP